LDSVSLWYRWSDDNSSWGDHSGEVGYDSVVIDNVASESDNSGVSSMSWSHTVSSGLNNSVLIVCTNVEDDDGGNNYFVDSVDFNGDALSRAVRDAADEGFSAVSEIWYLLSPDVGSFTVTVNFSQVVNNALGGSVSFSGVNQSVPDDTGSSVDTGSPSGLATSVSSDVDGSLIVSVATDGMGDYVYSYGSDQSEFYNVAGSTHEGAGSYRIPFGSGSFVMHTNLSSASNRMSQVVAVWSPSSFLWGNSSDWIEWGNVSNPDSVFPWGWNFDFPNGTGFYEFYSIGNKSGSVEEVPPVFADSRCYYNFSAPKSPLILSYDLINITGSKLNNASGLLDVNKEYSFLINISDSNGWENINFINITAWYDNGDEGTVYNQTSGGNLNMFLQYENITGVANWTMQWPDDEVELIIGNCSETIITPYERSIKFSFRPLSQIFWASSNETWDSSINTTNDVYSWNFNISVVDNENFNTWITDEYGIYKFTSHFPDNDWVDVFAAPGFSDTSNIVTITYSSNYNFNMSIYFEENLFNSTFGYTIPIANNVEILESADPNDDIFSDITFLGIGEANSIDIFNDSGIFHNNNVSQTVNVQFEIYVPIGTFSVKYKARVATKVFQK
jgi:hypothetical protein